MLWGSRFNKKIDDEALSFSSSLSFDIRLYKHDIRVSKAHADMLLSIGILSSEENIKIQTGLQKVQSEIENSTWLPDPNEFEDIHSAIEKRLTDIIGETAGKLHTGRSRNDQVATGVRLWMKESLIDLRSKSIDLQKSLIQLAEKHINTIIPGYTHLQRAQPISLAFHLLAYVEMLERTKNRLAHVFNEANVSPLGSGALAGSTLPLNREKTSNDLGFAFPSNNALDSVSDRDYIVDFLNVCVIGMMNLSRLSEELIIWSTKEWNFIRMGDEYSTGSSLMPQKKNPDIAELIRGKTGRVYGNYNSLITTVKSLPLSYNRDLQEDKEPLFDSYDTFSGSLKMMKGIIGTISINENRFVDELDGDFSLATDLADWLVMKNIPFRKSHEIVGQVVKLAESQNKKLNELSLEELKSIDQIFDESAKEVFLIETALLRKSTFGSPNPVMVSSQLKLWKEKL
ncbi:MAG: argininosuccinate lyase [Melioribacteraceae bacterium]|nr:argininosuccinate lyase [Melioribacteraceae bacterium]MCF8263533.1 argininosuccinate lyase [Melioribacteraceae bacterium]